MSEIKKELNEEELQNAAGGKGNWWDGHKGIKINHQDLKNHVGEHFLIWDEWGCDDPVDGYFRYESVEGEHIRYHFEHSSPKYMMSYNENDSYYLYN